MTNHPSKSAQVDVELRNVTKRFGDVTAVRNVSFTIARGEFFSILGPSGCGKTTTLRMLGGFIDPDEGEVWIGGNLVNGIPASSRNTNMVFQQLALFPHMTVFDNIGFGLKMKGVARNDIRRRVREMLQLVRLEGFDERRINQLSGGQQQRVAIARALINRPQVLLLDEPLGALDLQLRVEMQEELKRVQHEVGTTFVYVTHDQGEALTMSDRIGVMHDGSMIQIGNPTEIYEEPRTAFVAKFIGNTNLVRGDVQEQENGETMVRAGPLQIQGRTTDESVTGEVLISIRPEKIFLGEQAIGMANEFQGRITSAVFKGTAYEYRVSLNGDISLDVVVPNVEKGEQFPLDSSVIVGWSTTATHILPT